MSDKPRHYYNEFAPFPAKWLRNLMRDGHLPEGRVDERSIRDVRGDDLAEYDRCHFFAGIGGWELALALAGWPADRPVWTGSCPCQPFSAAGKGGGVNDVRHLWPDLCRLVAECRPPIVFGEQVASADGREWLAGVRADLEALGYAVGAADLCAAGAGAPHIRQRLFWVADAGSSSAGRHAFSGGVASTDREDGAREETGEPARHRIAGGIPDADGKRVRLSRRGADGRASSGVQGADGERQRLRPDAGAVHGVELARLLDADRNGCSPGNAASATARYRDAADAAVRPGDWSDFDIIPFADGKTRRVESILKSVADGIPGGLGPIGPAHVEAIEREVIDYAESNDVDAGQILRALWEDLSTRTLQRPFGRPDGVSSPAILLAFLCQLAEEGWRIADAIARPSAEAVGREMRGLRSDGEPSRASRERRLLRQSPREHSDVVRELSQIVARHAEEAWGEAFRSRAASTFPLAHGIANRVGRISAYGNAIPPLVAAEFIAAFLESLQAVPHA